MQKKIIAATNTSSTSTKNTELSIKTLEQTELYRRLNLTDKAKLERWLVWREAPEFSGIGRNGWLRLEHPIEASIGKQPTIIYALKIKGLGLYDNEGHSHRPGTRSLEPYHRIHQHIGFDEEGNFALLTSKPDAEGAITLPRAETEFHCTNTLANHGALTCLPLALYEIDDPALRVTIDTEPVKLGLVITGMPHFEPERLDIFFHRDLFTSKKIAIMKSWFGDPQIEINEDNRFLVVGKLLHSVGIAVKQFHDSGLFRHSGNLNNFPVIPQTKEAPARVLFTDLDSSLPQSVLNPLNKPLFLIRDLASILYGMITYSTRKDYIESAAPKQADLLHLMKKVVEGYFEGILDQGNIDRFIEILSTYYTECIGYAQDVYRQQALPENSSKLDYQAFIKDLVGQSWIKRFDVYTFLVFGLSQLYRASDLNKQDVLTQTEAGMLDSIARVTSSANAIQISQIFVS
jgi:hypothetical protein